jgi:hypothetical protein
MIRLMTEVSVNDLAEDLGVTTDDVAVLLEWLGHPADLLTPAMCEDVRMLLDALGPHGVRAVRARPAGPADGRGDPGETASAVQPAGQDHAMTDDTRLYARHLGLAAQQVCPDCGALVADTWQHDRWHLAFTTASFVPGIEDFCR